MIGTPTTKSPLEIGLLVDVSGSMTGAIKNSSGPSQNRLQSFQSALGDLASKARELSGNDHGDRLKLFAYGFGFGNPLGSFFPSMASPPVVDLLAGARHGSSTIGIKQLADDWAIYKRHVESLAIKMFGSTPMLSGIRTAAKRFTEDGTREKPCGKILFVLSDGEPTDATPPEVVSEVAKSFSDHTLVVSCYVTDHDITAPRHLYGAPQRNWPTGAKLMFDIASRVPADTPFSQYLNEHHWVIEPQARLFTQVNQSEVLAEFLQLLISPLSETHAVASASLPNTQVFVSFSHADEKWRDRLKVHLAPLVHSGDIDVWDDSRIATGQDWRREIEVALENAQVAILLVSADFLASDFIRTQELPTLLDAAKNRGAAILPIIVGPSRYNESCLGRFQAVNMPNSPLAKMSKEDAEEVLVKVSRDVERHLKK